MKKTKPLSDTELLALLKHDLDTGTHYNDSKLKKERRRVDKYYNGELPAPHHAGNAKYVSTDVYDTVESAKATLLETFSAHSDIVQFAPRGADDDELAKIATAYAKHVVFDLNPGSDIFADVIDNGLKYRNSVAKVWWDSDYKTIDERFEDLTEDELDEMLVDETVTDIIDLEVDEEGMFSGVLRRKEDCSQVRIMALPGEEVIVPPNARCLKTTPLISHRQEKTKADLISEGFDPRKVAQISSGRDNELDVEEERITRLEQVGGDAVMNVTGEKQDETRDHVVYETYIKANADGTRVKMWKVVHVDNIILDREEVDRHPFKSFAPLPTPHRFWGENFASRVIPTQNSKTVLTRSILDHAVITNNPRYGVVKGALTNPRELLDNRLGGLVNVTRQDGVFPLAQAPLNPFVFQTIGMLDDDKEDVTGVSRLSQGLNKDAISNQNSQGMVEQLIGASMQRQKTMARAFASQFLGPLFLEVYRLVVENEKRERIIEIAGSYVSVTPSSWGRQRDVTIDFRLGYGERDQRAAELVTLGQMIGQDPQVQHLFTSQERYNLYKAIMDTKGHKNTAMFLKDPATTQPPQPDPVAALEVQMRQQELQLNERKQALAEQKQRDDTMLRQFMADMDRRFQTLEFMLKSQDQDRKAAETENRIEVSEAEIALAAKAQAQAPAENNKASAIISPNG